MFDRRTDDALKAALGNKIVLRQIFSCLPLSGLKECRLVNRTWNVEAVSVMKDFRQCHAHISKHIPCSDLLALAQVVSGMIIVPINSLSIVLHGYGHSECKTVENQAKVLGTLLKTLPLKNLHVSWETAFKPLTCPATKFIIDLLRRKVLELSTLEFTYLPTKFRSYFGQIWAPWLPKLQVLHIGEVDRLDQKEFILQIISGAPNLKKIRGSCFDSEILEVLPEDKYSLLDDMWMSVESDTEMTNWSKLALAGPALSYLYFSAPWSVPTLQFMRSYIYVVEKIFASSCKSLKSFNMASPIFPLDKLKFPPLINVREISFSTEDTSPHLLHVLRSIDYPTLLPALHKVEVSVDMTFRPDNLMNPWENSEAGQVVQVHPSTTVKHLDISADFSVIPFKEFSQIFPNLVHLDATLVQPVDPAASASHIDLWAAWPYLESVYLS